MKSATLKSIRNHLGMERGALAQDLDVGSWKVLLWEMGLLPVPDIDARRVAALLAMQDTNDFKRKRGLRCEQMDAWDAQPDHEDPDEEDAFLDQVSRHMKTCRTCLAIDKYMNDRIEEVLRA